MDENKKFVLDKKIARTIENLNKNNMDAYYVQNSAEMLQKVGELLQDGNTVSVGGSMTLFETGLIEFLRNGNYNFLDRYKDGLTPSGIKNIYRESFSADAYLASCNAITEKGEIYNVDGNGNRVAAMIYGPDSVLLVVGVNKIVKGIDEAVERNRRYAAPANAKRLNRDTPCASLGYCTDCSSPDRICSSYVVLRQQQIKGRIKVIIVGEDLGY